MVWFTQSQKIGKLANFKNSISNVEHNTPVNTLKTSSSYSSLLKTIFFPPTAETKNSRYVFAKTLSKKFILCHLQLQMK